MIRVLVVRSEADLEEALTEVNNLLAFESQKAESSNDDQILGIWISKALDSALQCSCQKFVDPHQDAAQTEDEDGDGFLGVCWSTSSSGVWTLSSLDGSALGGIDDTPAKRKVAIRHISRSLGHAKTSLKRSSFLPVFNAEMPLETLQFELDQLQREYPLLVRSRALRHDQAVGIRPL